MVFFLQKKKIPDILRYGIFSLPLAAENSRTISHQRACHVYQQVSQRISRSGAKHTGKTTTEIQYEKQENESPDNCKISA